MLYPAELLARTLALYKKIAYLSTEKHIHASLRVLFCCVTHILLRLRK